MLRSEKRAERVLLGEGKWPVASEMGPAAAAATNGLIIDLRCAVADIGAVLMSQAALDLQNNKFTLTQTSAMVYVQWYTLGHAVTRRRPDSSRQRACAEHVLSVATEYFIVRRLCIHTVFFSTHQPVGRASRRPLRWCSIFRCWCVGAVGRVKEGLFRLFRLFRLFS